MTTPAQALADLADAIAEGTTPEPPTADTLANIIEP